MTEPTTVHLHDQDRNETAYYAKAKLTDKILVPLTREGVAALTQRALDLYDLPHTEAATYCVCAFLHHIPREVNTTTIKDVAAAVHKQSSSICTYAIIEEMNKKAQVEARDGKLAAVASIAPATEAPLVSDETTA